MGITIAHVVPAGAAHWGMVSVRASRGSSYPLRAGLRSWGRFLRYRHRAIPGANAPPRPGALPRSNGLVGFDLGQFEGQLGFCHRQGAENPAVFLVADRFFPARTPAGGLWSAAWTLW